jgi:(S)-citramalyl-CoA lyase
MTIASTDIAELPRKQPRLDSPVSTPLRTRLRACRSFLLTPATRPDAFGDGRDCGGDAIIVDLESTVRPDHKERARDAALAFLRQPSEPEFMRILRINSPRTAAGLRDLLMLHESGVLPDTIVIPSCQSADEIRLVADVLDGSQSVIGLIPTVELARAVFVADLIANAHERVCGLFLSSGDAGGERGAEGSWVNLQFARSRIVAAAARAAIAAIDGPCVKDDDASITQEATASRELGMTGKAALYADQLAMINTVFTPRQKLGTRASSVISVGGVSGSRSHGQI